MAHTAKTGKVLGLFDGSQEQPVLTNPAFKAPEKEAVPAVFMKSDNGTQFVNVGFLLINEQLGGIMERFHCCTCDICISAVTAEILKNLPERIVRVKRKSDADEVNRAAAEMRSEAIRVITKAVMFVKSNPRH
ncbi:MAG: late competence development ComFB family protein [Ruminiclostridium sp.]|nr:late competence development ComFB family protein [Ruminiclostridium sp.]HBI51178.1 hypothetical protein [Oscillospiraceae bacterium]